MFKIASLPVIRNEENTDDDRNIAAIQRWENLVLNQHKIRQKQRLWSALGESLLRLHPRLRARLSETDRVRDDDEPARAPHPVRRWRTLTGASSSGIAEDTANDVRDETAV